MEKKIAIIGAGSSGLCAIKSCKEEGFLPVCYERNGEPGGLWRYHDEDIEGVASVMRTTIMNTSKETSAFSDFPPPKSSPNYMHNTQLFDYFMSYAEHFDLLRHIRYKLEVVKVEPTKDFEKTGQWVVSVKSTQTEAVTKETFDGVMVCIGHHVFPNFPIFPNQAKFKGSIIHTHSLKSCDQFKEKIIAIIGIGNSAVDAAIDATFVAKQVYLSTRRGSWIFARVGKKGAPLDIHSNSRLKALRFSYLSYDSYCDRIEKELNSKFDHAAYNLKPKHRVLSCQPTMNDALPCAVLSGKVIVKGDIERFEENGVVFAGESFVTEVEAVIVATGYLIKFPFLDKEIVPTENNQVNLYKYSIPPHLKQPTLGIIGLIQPIGPIFPVSEMQSRWFLQIQAGKVSLPSKEEMEKEIFQRKEMSAKRFIESVRHTIQVDWIPYMDELAEMMNVKPNFIKMAINDPNLFWACMNGPCLPYQFRLVGPHSWEGAREAILNLDKRVYAPLNKDARKPSEPSATWKSKPALYIATLATLGVAICSTYGELLSQYLVS